MNEYEHWFVQWQRVGRQRFEYDQISAHIASSPTTQDHQQTTQTEGIFR